MLNSAAIDEIAECARTQWEVPGLALGIVNGSCVVHADGYGIRALTSDEPVTAETVFAAASLTKAFTATALSMAVSEQQLDWNDPVGQYLEYFRLDTPQSGQEVQIRDLLAHRVGLARHDLLWYGAPRTREEVVRRIACLKPENPIRSIFQYNNILYSVAGLTLAAASGLSWEDLVEERVFLPLGMTSSSLSIEKAETAENHATPHRRAAEGNIEEIPWRDLTNIAPAGAVNTNVVDLAKWIACHLAPYDPSIKVNINRSALRETHMPQIVVRLEGRVQRLNPETSQMSYAMGWSILDYRGIVMLTHDGAIDGFRTRLALLPKQRLGIAILSNLDSTFLPEALRNSLLDYLLGFETRDWNQYYLAQPQRSRRQKLLKSSPSDRPLSVYVGVYRHCAYGDAFLTLGHGKLMLSWSSFNTSLIRIAEDVFAVAEMNALEFASLFFERDANGIYQHLLFLGQRFSRTAKPIVPPEYLKPKPAGAEDHSLPLEEFS